MPRPVHPSNPPLKSEARKLAALRDLGCDKCGATFCRRSGRYYALCAKCHADHRAANSKRPRKTTHTKAHHAVKRAVDDGILIRPGQCDKCGRIPRSHYSRIEAHHESYEPIHWLDVIWLCGPCHKARHVELRKQLA